MDENCEVFIGSIVTVPESKEDCYNKISQSLYGNLTSSEPLKKSGAKCCIWNCSKYTGDKDISFHRLPKDTKERERWLNIIGPNCKSADTSLHRWTPTSSSRICGLHFTISPKVGQKRSHRKLSLNKKRLLLEPEMTTQNIVHAPVPEPETWGPGNLNSTCSDGSFSFGCADETVPTTSKLDISIGFSEPNITNVNDNCSEQLHIASEENARLKMKNAELEKEILSLKDEVKNLNLSLTTACNKLIQMDLQNTINETASKRKMFKAEDAIDDPQALKFYTGFESKERFLIFYRFMMKGYETAKNQVNGRADPKNTFKKKPIIDPMNQLFLVLCRLRLGLLEQDLAYRCKVSVSTINNIWCFWVDYLATRLVQIPIWPSRKLVNEHMPEQFLELYSSTRVILDCTEIFIENPSEFRVQSDTYSSYKSHNTAKGLVGISPNGAITFVSELSPGRISDKELTLSSGLLNLLEPGDSLMADRGFIIEDELNSINVRLNIPPFLNGKTSLSFEEEKTTREIASLRIHVERVIRQIKTFGILKHTFPNAMSDKLNKIWKICCYMLNFMGNPLLEKNQSVEL